MHGSARWKKHSVLSGASKFSEFLHIRAPHTPASGLGGWPLPWSKFHRGYVLHASKRSGSVSRRLQLLNKHPLYCNFTMWQGRDPLQNVQPPHVICIESTPQVSRHSTSRLFHKSPTERAGHEYILFHLWSFNSLPIIPLLQVKYPNSVAL